MKEPGASGPRSFPQTFDCPSCRKAAPHQGQPGPWGCVWQCLEELPVVTTEQVEDPAGQVQEFCSEFYSAGDPSYPGHTHRGHLACKAEKLPSGTRLPLCDFREQNGDDWWKRWTGRVWLSSQEGFLTPRIHNQGLGGPWR